MTEISSAFAAIKHFLISYEKIDIPDATNHHSPPLRPCLKETGAASVRERCDKEEEGETFKV